LTTISCPSRPAGQIWAAPEASAEHRREIQTAQERVRPGCLHCHFLSLFSITFDGKELNPLAFEYRNTDSLSKLLHKLDPRLLSIKCFHGMWDAEKIGYKNTDKIEIAILRDDRRKCSLFSPHNPEASLTAVVEMNRRTEEVIDRKFTRRLAWAAIIVSAFATILAAAMPTFLSLISRR
jgi:hypothetical protein